VKKAEKELEILKLIYDLSKYKRVAKSEKPDFILYLPVRDYRFGVEISEFYFSESDARLRNIPNYVTEILNKNAYRHKDDRKELKVQDATLISQDKKEQTIQGILKELPPTGEYGKLIAKRLAEKSEKLSNYNSSLGHVNLIIYDTENRLIGTEKKYFYYHFFNDDLRKEIIGSEFREIFLITTLSKKNKVFVPLKLLFVLSELYLLNGFLVEYKNEVKINTGLQDVEIFGDFLMRKGVATINIRQNKDAELIYGNYGIKGRTTISSYSPPGRTP